MDSPDMKIKQLFGDGVRKRRLELDLSQEKLAEKASLHRTYIGDVERGERNISLENIEKITQALEITIVDFFANYVAFPEGEHKQ